MSPKMSVILFGKSFRIYGTGENYEKGDAKPMEKLYIYNIFATWGGGGGVRGEGNPISQVCEKFDNTRNRMYTVWMKIQ